MLAKQEPRTLIPSPLRVMPPPFRAQAAGHPHRRLPLWLLPLHLSQLVGGVAALARCASPARSTSRLRAHRPPPAQTRLRPPPWFSRDFHALTCLAHAGSTCTTTRPSAACRSPTSRALPASTSPAPETWKCLGWRWKRWGEPAESAVPLSVLCGSRGSGEGSRRAGRGRELLKAAGPHGQAQPTATACAA